MTTTSIEINRPAEQGYDYVTDPTQFHEWQHVPLLVQRQTVKGCPGTSRASRTAWRQSPRAS
jgi:uncharacterized protein YndB with AHSA1/START domain